MINPRVYRKFKECIDLEDRDIAFIALPGMGLSELLTAISEKHKVGRITLDSIQSFQLEPFKQPRYLIHAVIIEALSKCGGGYLPIEKDNISSVNLFQYFRLDHKILEDEPIFLVIEEFTELDNSVARLFCDEMKHLHDQRHEITGLESLRFIIGGPIDFNELYGTSKVSSVSPATNFRKFYPQDFLLTYDEMDMLLRSLNSHYSSLPGSVKNLVFDWANGYVHYAIHFTNWVTTLQREEGKIDTQYVIRNLQLQLSECNYLEMFSYCDTSWNRIKEDQPVVEVLAQAITVGLVSSSAEAILLSKLGLLMPKSHNSVYVPINNLITLFFRQRLSEVGLILPLDETTQLFVAVLNEQAYRLILLVESCLRTFIGDLLFRQYKSEWLEKGIKPCLSARGKSIYDETIEKLQQDQDSPFTDLGTINSFLQFLEISDLLPIISCNEKIFSNYSQLVRTLPVFMDEINYIRRRVAHGRSITENHINILQQRWTMVQNMMRKR